MLSFNIRGKTSLCVYCKPFAVLPRTPRKTGAGLPKGRMLRPPVSAFPPDPGLRVRGNLRGGSASATLRRAFAPFRNQMGAFEPCNPDGSLRAPATMTKGLRALANLAGRCPATCGGVSCAPATQTGVSAPASTEGRGATPSSCGRNPEPVWHERGCKSLSAPAIKTPENPHD